MALSNGIEPLLRGAAISRQAEISPQYSNALQNYLFGCAAFGGRDLLALDIQRGRDHGLPFYNSARTQLQLDAKTSFSDITSDYRLAAKLEEIYGTIDNVGRLLQHNSKTVCMQVDAYIGGLAEDPPKDHTMGELFASSWVDQFRRIRDGDRFYFENTANGLFSEEDVSAIHETSED